MLDASFLQLAGRNVQINGCEIASSIHSQASGLGNRLRESEVEKRNAVAPTLQSAVRWCSSSILHCYVRNGVRGLVYGSQCQFESPGHFCRVNWDLVFWV